MAGTAEVISPNQMTGRPFWGNPQIASNDEFIIEFLGHRMHGDLATFLYEVRRIRSGDSPYHWVLSLCQMTDLAEGKTIRDLVVGATRNGAPVSFREEEVQGQAFLGLDSATHIEGFRFDDGRDAGARYTITFDTSVLQEGCVLGIGSVLAATKAGNQDIRDADAVCPGYLCIPGPVCACIPSVKTCETAFAFGDERAKPFLEFPVPAPGRHHWGWTNGPFEEGVHELELQITAGACEPAPYIPVGAVYVLYRPGIATVVYDMDGDYALEEVHLYVGSEPLPRDAQGNISVAPAQFPCTEDGLGGVADYTFVVYDLSGPIYVVAHATVCRQE